LGSPGNVCCFSIGGDHFTSRASLLVTQVPSQRRVALPTANSTFGVGVGTPGALANSSLSSGWQVGETHCPPFPSVHPGPRYGGVLHLLPSVTSRRAQHRRPVTLSQVRVRCRSALMWLKDGGPIAERGRMTMQASLRW
jgi:hypothetical protein